MEYEYYNKWYDEDPSRGIATELENKKIQSPRRSAFA